MMDISGKKVSTDEIKSALFDMGLLKAPDCDGFHTYFFQNQWDMVGDAVVIFSKDIALEQAVFVVGRNITDDIIIAPEVIHSMISKQNNRNWMALKIDLDKAYDRISWEFINVSLQATCIPNFLCNVIMFAIMSSSMQVLRSKCGMKEDLSDDIVKDRLWISDEIIKCIVSIPPSHDLAGPNKITWMDTPTGSFTLKSAYWKLSNRLWNPKDATWRIP
ncbi:hypothetical protein J1N35_021408 [Gossypium stocksii]|uniref:Reverse transcriptase domain-containing protein n=1 Tax=Gossypium stocksii TaxID=47602 RepID=A0A9D3VFN1_9ROSI|nr:hypothetical protein J1N35_021408 [Gossypium stocksii]